jgi:hypothetical protein
MNFLDRWKEWWKQAKCLHWFDAPVSYQFSESSGPIIATQQKSWTITEEVRTCCKCGFKDARRVDAIYEGWT